MITTFVNFQDAIDAQINELKNHWSEVDAGRWQGVSTEGHPDLVTREVLDVAFRVSMDRPVPPSAPDWVNPHDTNHALNVLRVEIEPNLPWADDHFEERVSRVPSNPGEQYKNWPWWSGQVELTNAEMRPTYEGDKQLTNFKFSHTYQERFWPKHAGHRQPGTPKNWCHAGIRYQYGDLDDVVNMLLKDPYTRQAYLPIFFPEDTGAVHGGRIPCSLGYHFLLRNDSLHLWYEIRSCDAVRHFRDDVYLAARLALWMIEELASKSLSEGPEDWTPGFWHNVRPGVMTFHCHSFHVHKGDIHLL